jgi:hypothetical protein
MGMKQNANLAYSFRGISNELHVVGDCRNPYDVKTSIQSAFGAAVQL